jgi:DNA-directed RNA polymerase I, II, and III subunit RPABC5
MIIPIKCFTCGKVLADKYRYYQDEVRRIKMAKYDELSAGHGFRDNVMYFTKENMEKTTEGTVLDKLHLHNVCCRRHMLTHVDME